MTVLAAHNVEARHKKALTGHKSDQSIESYNARISFQQKENMSNILSHFVSGQSPTSNDESSPHPSDLAGRFNSGFDRLTLQLQPQNQHVVQIQNFSQPQPYSIHNCMVSIVDNYR